MKDIVKGVIVKIVFTVLIVAVLAGGGFLVYHHYFDQNPKSEEEEPITQVEIVKEKLENAAELNTASYLCTYVFEKRDPKFLNGWELPFTEKFYIFSYEGLVKAGIKNLEQAQITQKDNQITIKLPKVEITNVDLDNDSLQVYDQSTNIFNPTKIEDLNEDQKVIKEKMKERAEECGLLELAKTNAEVMLNGMLSYPNEEYEILIEWEE